MQTATREFILSALRNRRAFSRGTMSAERNGPFRRGMLPESEWQQIYRDEPTYIVYSYGTPIAWQLADGSLYVPEVGYSVTTSRHQALVREVG